MSLFSRYRVPLLVTAHAVLVTCSYILAYLLRFDWVIPEAYVNVMLITLPVIVGVRLGAFSWFQLYRTSWRYVGMRDLQQITKAILAGSVLFAAVMQVWRSEPLIPRSVYYVEAMLALFLIGGVRFGLRAALERRREARVVRQHRVVIVGAGDAGELLLREMFSNPRLGYQPVAFVDDDLRKVGTRIHGVDVAGTIADLPAITSRMRADEIVIAIPSVNRRQMEEIVNRCLQTRLPVKTVPSIATITDGAFHMKQLRPVRLEDLLGRAPVNLEVTRLRADITGRRVIITGAGGSIGSELARQVAEFQPGRLVLLERSENGLYMIEQELRRKHPEITLIPLICDVSATVDVQRIWGEEPPDLVYHAAAFKHVPLMESHLLPAIENNVFGTLAIAAETARHGAKLVLISTDKAVAPSNVMGATKRLAETIVLQLATRHNAHFVAVRFGNVLGSAGSVVPLFTQQIADGGPVTVTHADATRYFMTIPEAVQLVLEASVLEEARDRIVMLEMGEPVKIIDLARNLIRLSGLEPEVDIPITYTGLRPGEKLHEQLLSETEATAPTRFDKIRIVQTRPTGPLDERLQQLREMVGARDERGALRMLQELVPEFTPQAELIARLRAQMIRAEPRTAQRDAG